MRKRSCGETASTVTVTQLERATERESNLGTLKMSLELQTSVVKPAALYLESRARRAKFRANLLRNLLLTR